MSKLTDDFKIILVSTSEGLEQSVEVNTLSQFSIKFSYLKKWMDVAKQHCPEDSENIKKFFKRIETWDSKSFKLEKFRQVWIEYNMEDISDYRLK